MCNEQNSKQMQKCNKSVNLAIILYGRDFFIKYQRRKRKRMMMLITDDYYYNDDAHEVFTAKLSYPLYVMQFNATHMEIKEEIHFMIQLTYLLLCYSWFTIKTCLHAQITRKQSLASSWHPSPKYEDKYSLNLLFH